MRLFGKKIPPRVEPPLPKCPDLSDISFLQRYASQLLQQKAFSGN